MTDTLLSWRKEFPILDRTVYMISHSLGAMPRRTRDRLNQFADEWDTRGIRAWEEGWWEMPVTVGAPAVVGTAPRAEGSSPAMGGYALASSPKTTVSPGTSASSPAEASSSEANVFMSF